MAQRLQNCHSGEIELSPARQKSAQDSSGITSQIDKDEDSGSSNTLEVIHTAGEDRNGGVSPSNMLGTQGNDADENMSVKQCDLTLELVLSQQNSQNEATACNDQIDKATPVRPPDLSDERQQFTSYL